MPFGSRWRDALKAYRARLWIQPPWEGVPEGFRDLPLGRFQVPADLAEWQQQREGIRNIVCRSLGEIPPKPASAEVRTHSVIRQPGVRIEKFVFDNGVDSKVPGYIAIPDNGRQRYPAILAMHGHSSSKEHVFGFQKSPQNVAATLARSGYVVLTIDNYFNGERRGTGPAGLREKQNRRTDQEQSLVKLNLWLGRTLWGMMLRDEQMALDYLVSRPEVDPERIGAQGMSMGSTRACWLAAIDDRIKAVVAVACFTRYEDLIAARQLRAHGIYFFVPGILSHFDAEGILALVAPRPLLALTGDRDEGSPIRGVETLGGILRSIYALYRQEQAFESKIYPQTGHVYNDDMKEKMLKWFGRHL